MTMILSEAYEALCRKSLLRHQAWEMRGRFYECVELEFPELKELLLPEALEKYGTCQISARAEKLVEMTLEVERTAGIL